MDIFGDIERTAGDLYPYRWPITIGAIVVLLAAAAIAYRLRWHEVLWRRRLLTTAVSLALLAAAVPAGWYTLSPLWQRSHLDEPSPLSAAPLPTTQGVQDAASNPQPAVARLTHEGMFRGADDFHFGRGTVQLIETAPGMFTLRFEDFSVRNGPDLFVYLAPDPASESVDGAINLGKLKATDGAFNYEVPAGTDVSRFAGVVVWCRRFSALFAVAQLTPL